MIKNILSAGCSFTYGHELSDCNKPGLPPSQKTWAAGIVNKIDAKHLNVSAGGIGNQAIARKVFQNINKHETRFLVLRPFLAFCRDHFNVFERFPTASF